MKSPPLLLAAALLFWGWQTGHPFLGPLFGLMVELSRVSRRRWEFSDVDLKRIWLLCLALQAGASLVLYSTQDRAMLVFKFVQALPVSLLPLMLAQAWGGRAEIPVAIFSWPATMAPDARSPGLNITYPYFAVCVAAASASTQANAYFYLGVSVLILAAMASSRPHRVRLLPWLALATIAVVGGQYTHEQMRLVQTSLENSLGGLIAELLPHHSPDARVSRTMIGQPSERYHSSRIVWRLTPEGQPPPLLCQSVFDGYRNEIWTCVSNDFHPAGAPDADTFNLIPSNSVEFDLHLSGYIDDEGPLPMPHGTFQVSGVAPARVQTNRLGCADVDNAPALLECVERWYPAGSSLDPPPSFRDTNVTDTERPIVTRIVSQLGLAKMTDRQKVRAISRYFAEHFTYSLTTPSPREGRTSPIGTFLTKTRTGHCEFFATATVLLLRAAGIPARYATGYAVPENSRQGQTYLVRERYAHAWALAYNRERGLWEEVDTTPSSWEKRPPPGPAWIEPVSDFGSQLFFRFSKWRASKTSLARYASWLLAPVIATLLWRIIASQRGHAARHQEDEPEAPTWPGMDSELFLIDRRLAGTSLARRPGETLAAWQERLESSHELRGASRLRRICRLHRLLRFDPAGISPADRQTLKDEAQEWMAEFQARQAKP